MKLSVRLVGGAGGKIKMHIAEESDDTFASALTVNNHFSR